MLFNALSYISIQFIFYDKYIFYDPLTNLSFITLTEYKIKRSIKSTLH